jgi:hypothetical protein
VDEGLDGLHVGDGDRSVKQFRQLTPRELRLVEAHALDTRDDADTVARKLNAPLEAVHSAMQDVKRRGAA